MKTNEYSHETTLQGRSKQCLTDIIPTLNEIAYLPGLLMPWTYKPRLPDEVIVVDAGSTDGTAELARTRGARVIRGGMQRWAQRRSSCSRRDLLLFLDADVLPPPKFIAQVLDEFERKEYHVATCFIAALDENPLIG